MNTNTTTTENMKADFCIKIDFEKGSESPSRVFRTMSELIETFEALDVGLVQSIDAKIEPVVIIEDIEAGSIKAWLRTVLRAVDDQAIKNIDWKPAVGRYLVKAKYIVLKFMEDKTKITTREEIQQLEKHLLKSAEETDIIHFPSYVPIQRRNLLPNIEKLTKALSHLTENDKAIYISAEGETIMNAEFRFIPEEIEELLTQKTLTSQSDMILKVKKPDYLGESQWEFRHGTHPIFAKILDSNWLVTFQSREYDVRPGDSLRAIVETQVKYGFDNEVVATHYYIIKVNEIIRMPPMDQLGLLPEEEE